MKHIDSDDLRRIGQDPDLMEAFYREYAEAVKAFHARRTSDPHQVADLTADTFLAALQSAPTYRPASGTPSAWLHGIARNVHADSLRRTARRLRAERRLQGRRLLDEDATAHLLDRIESERLTRALYAGIASLPKRDRLLMERVAVDGVSITEAAQELGVKPATARVRLHRCRARLQSQLATGDVLASLGQEA